MKYLFTLLFACIGTFAHTQTIASTSSSPSTIEYNWEMTDIEEDWTFYANEAEQAIYIDLAKVGQRVAFLQVRKADGTLVKEESLRNVPVDAIYTMEYRDWERGHYQIELHTYQQIIRFECEQK